MCCGEPFGEFSIRSAYKILQKDLMVHSATEFYKHLWGQDLPSKIKVTIWRISWKYIITFVNLNYKKISN